jgi:hypothetical protein
VKFTALDAQRIYGSMMQVNESEGLDQTLNTEFTKAVEAASLKGFCEINYLTGGHLHDAFYYSFKILSDKEKASSVCLYLFEVLLNKAKSFESLPVLHDFLLASDKNR